MVSFSGFYTYRSPLFAPFRAIGITVQVFRDPVIDGQNMELLDTFEWQRRPGFSKFCSATLGATEIVNQFYSNRDLTGVVHPLFDSTTRLAEFSSSTITTILSKNTTSQGFITAVGNFQFFTDGLGADASIWDTILPLSAINPFAQGLPAPIQLPQLSSTGCWLPGNGYSVNAAIQDPNGNVQVVSSCLTGTRGTSGTTTPNWAIAAGSQTNDGNLTWLNVGPIETWLADTYFPVPVAVVDPNGNLQVCAALSQTAQDWSSTTNYTISTIVFFAGSYWICLATGNTGIPPNSTSVNGSGTPYWSLTTSPAVTGIQTPTWNQNIGQTTLDGNYTWVNLGPGNLLMSFGTSYVYCYRTIYGHLSTASPVSINTGAVFGPQVATITGYSISDGIVTFQAVNNFQPGYVFTVTGLSTTDGLLLNNQTFVALGNLSNQSSNPVQAGKPVGRISTYAGSNITASAQNNLTTPTQVSAYTTLGNTSGVVSDSGSTAGLVAEIIGQGTASPLCSASVTITASAVSAGIVTIYAANSFSPGLYVTFSGLTVATFLNNIQLQIIAVDPNFTWFQVYYTNALGIVPPNQAKTTDTGTATFNAIEIYRTSDGGGTYLFAGAVTNITGSGTGTPSAYDSGFVTAGSGSNNTTSGTYVWSNPNNVTGSSGFATSSISAPGSTSFSLVQSGESASTSQTSILSSSPQTMTVSLSGVVAGHAIVVAIASAFMTVTSITDNNGRQYQLAAQASLVQSQGVSENVGQVSLYYVPNVAAGSLTVTVIFNPNVPPNTAESLAVWGVQVFEVSGITGIIESPASNTLALNTTSTSFSAAPVSVNSPSGDSVVFTSVLASTFNGLPSVTVPSGYSGAGTNQSFSGNANEVFHTQATAYEAQSANGAFYPTWSIVAGTGMVGVSVAFDVASVSPATDNLYATNFTFPSGGVPSTVDITAIYIQFTAFVTASPVTDSVITVSLLRDGVLYGTPRVVYPSGSSTSYNIGGDTWGGIWLPGDFNNSSWGVSISGQQSPGGPNATYEVQKVQARVMGTESGSTATSTWVFDDFTTDADLNIELIAPLAHLNDPPPGSPGSTIQQAGTVTTYWKGRLWMAVGNYVYFTAGPDSPNGDPNQSWPPGNRFQFAGPVLGIQPSPDGAALLIALSDRVNAILGGPETISFYPSDAFGNFGIPSVNAIFRDGASLNLLTTQGQLFQLEGNSKADIGEHIADYLMNNFSSASSYVTVHRNGLDSGTWVSNGVDRVVRYGLNLSAWSVPYFPSFGAGALRSIETSAGTYSLMLASPTAGSYLYARDLDSWSDAGVYGDNDGTDYTDCYITFGSITFAEPGGELFPLQHVVLYLDPVGTLTNNGPSHPSVAILPNEISDTAGVGFVPLPESVYEPPIGQNTPSRTILQLRYPVDMMNSALASQFVAHAQVMISFQKESAPNLIKSLSFKGNQSI